MKQYASGKRPSARDRERSRQVQRYGVPHRRRRSAIAPLVAAGLVECVRCGLVIEPGEPWDLGHVDGSLEHSGPEHRSCNRGAPHRNGTSRVW
jgi:hypothetical protein